MPLINDHIPTYCLFWGEGVRYIVSLVPSRGCSKMQEEGRA